MYICLYFFKNMINTDNISINLQSSIKIKGTKTVYFDPYEIEDKSADADVIFITHDHPDHFQSESISKIVKDDTKLIMPLSMKKHAFKVEIPLERITFLEPNQIKEMQHLVIETVPAYNKLKPFHPKKSGFLGYIVTMDNVRYYVAGDTDNINDINKVRCDIALLPIGGTFTMNAKDAASLANAIGPKVAIPTHYGNIVGSEKDVEIFKENCSKNIDVVIKLK